MVLVNLKLARKLSKRKFDARKKTREYIDKLQKFELHITFTNNNIFVNFSNGVGNSMFLKTFGMIGYNGGKRKTRYALYYYGLESGLLLLDFLKKYCDKNKIKKIGSLTLILHNVLIVSDFRYRRFMDGFKKNKIKFTNVVYQKVIPYNGCKKSKKRRSRRIRTTL